MRVIVGAPGNGAALKNDIKNFLDADDRTSAVIDISEADITYPEVGASLAFEDDLRLDRCRPPDPERTGGQHPIRRTSSGGG